MESTDIHTEELYSPMKEDFRSMDYHQSNSQMNKYTHDEGLRLAKRATQLSE